MINNNRYSPETQFFIPGEAETKRKPYQKPILEDLGSLLDLTLGGSPGVGDSGTSLSEKPPGGHKPKKVLLDNSNSGNDLTFKKTKPSQKP